MADTLPIESSEQANSNKTFCPGKSCNLPHRDLILAISQNCLLNWTVLPTAAGGIPALNGKSSGWMVASSISVSTGMSAGLSSTDLIPVSVAVLCSAWLKPSTGGSGGSSTFAASSALTNMSNLALHLLLRLPFNLEHALQSGVAPKRILPSRVIYSCRIAGDASDWRLEKGTSFGRYLGSGMQRKYGITWWHISLVTRHRRGYSISWLLWLHCCIINCKINPFVRLWSTIIPPSNKEWRNSIGFKLATI